MTRMVDFPPYLHGSLFVYPISLFRKQQDASLKTQFHPRLVLLPLKTNGTSDRYYPEQEDSSTR